MDLETSNSNGFVMLDYKDAMLRWSKSWAELAKDNLTHDTLKVEDLESDAGYASEGSFRRFYVGSKSGSVGSLDDGDDRALYEEFDFRRSSDDVYDIADDRDDVSDNVDDLAEDAADDVEDGGEEGLDVSIEMIGSECVLVNGYQPDDLPCPDEATRDGMTPEVILEYDHQDVVELACRYLAHLEGRNEQYVRPKICWAMKFAPDFDEDSESSQS